MNVVNKIEDTATTKAVVDFLKDLSCCDRCVLRFLGCKTYSRLYEASSSEIAEKIALITGAEKHVEPPAKKVECNYCSACLGILQKGCQVDELRKITSEVASRGFKFRQFHLAISVPVSLTHRNHIILTKLQSAFPDLEYLQGDYIVSVKDVWRLVLKLFICQEFTGSSEIDKAPFVITVWTSHESINEECSALFADHPELLKVGNCKRSMATVQNGSTTLNHFNHSSVMRVIEKLGDRYFATMPIDCPANSFQIDRIECKMDSVYIVGRYNKYSRLISQSPWKVAGDHSIVSSIEEILSGPISAYFKGESIRFSASGREDVDVRMLGRGRPFVIEVLNPLTRSISPEDIAILESDINAINKDVCVRDLQESNKHDVQVNIQEGQSEKRKQYTAYGCCSRALTEEDVVKVRADGAGLTINQKTPVRVLHRRSLATRRRTILSISLAIDPNDPRLFTAVMETEAGTYIKEFVHSDFGRTHPSLATLVGDCEMDILNLDVMDVSTDWPPSVLRQT